MNDTLLEKLLNRNEYSKFRKILEDNKEIILEAIKLKLTYKDIYEVIKEECQMNDINYEHCSNIIREIKNKYGLGNEKRRKNFYWDITWK